MFKKIVKFTLYTVGGINLGVASAFCPLFLAIFFALSNSLYVALPLSAGLCALIVTAIYLLHFYRRKQEHDSPDYRVSGAYVGFVLGAVAAIVIVITMASAGPEGPLTGS